MKPVLDRALRRKPAAFRPDVHSLVMCRLPTDGPRADKPEDPERCEAVRQLFDDIDWPCEVHKDFSDHNMGCRRRVASGISWAFELMEEAIILEDDCLPDQGFFRYCQELLEYYRHDRRVMHIGGTNLAPRPQRVSASYVFSRHSHCWGWATWRRAWALYDHEMVQWPAVRDGGWLHDYLANDQADIDFWSERFDAVADNKLDSWATIWMFSCWVNNGLSILPVANQVTNIGLGIPDATHTGGEKAKRMMKATEPMTFPLKHPTCMIRDSRTDAYANLHQLGIKGYAGVPGFFRRFRRWRRRFLNRSV